MPDHFLDSTDATYSDWTGVASAENDATRPQSMYELANLDADRWFIVALDLFASGQRPNFELVTVYAADRGLVTDQRALMAVADDQRKVPVTSFSIPDVGVANVIAALKGLHVRIAISGLEGRDLDLSELTDPPSRG